MARHFVLRHRWVKVDHQWPTEVKNTIEHVFPREDELGLDVYWIEWEEG